MAVMHRHKYCLAPSHSLPGNHLPRRQWFERWLVEIFVAEAGRIQLVGGADCWQLVSHSGGFVGERQWRGELFALGFGRDGILHRWSVEIAEFATIWQPVRLSPGGPEVSSIRYLVARGPGT